MLGNVWNVDLRLIGELLKNHLPPCLERPSVVTWVRDRLQPQQVSHELMKLFLLLSYFVCVCVCVCVCNLPSFSFHFLSSVGFFMRRCRSSLLCRSIMNYESHCVSSPFGCDLFYVYFNLGLLECLFLSSFLSFRLSFFASCSAGLIWWRNWIRSGHL